MSAVHLILKHYWYDEIESGRKRIEYRDNSPYWRKRLEPLKRGGTVVFHRAYTHVTMSFKVEQVIMRPTIEIHLGARLA